MPSSPQPSLPTRHIVRVGDTLDRIAAKYYGDATAWRSIAVANDIEDPLAVRPGSVLLIPKRAV